MTGKFQRWLIGVVVTAVVTAVAREIFNQVMKQS